MGLCCGALQHGWGAPGIGLDSADALGCGVPLWMSDVILLLRKLVCGMVL